MSTVGRVIPRIGVRSLPVPCETITASLCANRRIIFSGKGLFTTVQTSVSVPSLFGPIGCKVDALVSKNVTGSLPIGHIMHSGNSVMITFSMGRVSMRDVRSILAHSCGGRLRDRRFRRAGHARLVSIFSRLQDSSSVDLVGHLGRIKDHDTSVLHRCVGCRERHSSRRSVRCKRGCCSLLSHAFDLVGGEGARLSLTLRGPSILIEVPFSDCNSVSSCTGTHRVSSVNCRLVDRRLRHCRGGGV